MKEIDVGPVIFLGCLIIGFFLFLGSMVYCDYKTKSEAMKAGLVQKVIDGKVIWTKDNK